MREPVDVFFLRMARLAATRTTCPRRSVGAVAVDERGYEMAIGWNGVPAGILHCNEGHPCAGAKSPSGTDLDACLAVHAEVNLLAKCADVWKIRTVYLTVSPCFSCTKSLLTTGCERLVFLEEYPHPAARALWLRVGRIWQLHPPVGIDHET